jgi:hypothetical protein
MGSSRLSRYISSLSDEDKEKFKPLIDDALRRDRALAEVFCEAKRHAESYEADSKRLMETTREFHASLLRLNGKLAGIAEASVNAFRGIPYGAAGNGGSTVRH